MMQRLPSKKVLYQTIKDLEWERDELRRALAENEEHYYKETKQLSEIIEIQRHLLRQDGIDIKEEFETIDVE